MADPSRSSGKDLERIPTFPEEASVIAADPKPLRLSLHLIVKRHLPSGAGDWPQDKIISELNKVKRVRLDRENIGEMDSFELFSTQVTHLYLQCNKIRTIENLEYLPQLQVLVLSNNQVKEVSGINHLEKLLFLDLSHNCLEYLNCDNLPKNIIILNLSGNEALNESKYLQNVLKSLPKLKQLNGREISTKDKIAAGAVDEWGEKDVDENSEDEEDGEEDEDESNEYEGQRQERDSTELESGIFRPPLATRSNSDFEMPTSSVYKQLPKIESSIQGLAADMLLRSQQRLEDVALQHKRNLQHITNMKIKAKIKPMPHISREQPG